jgi:dihydroflavonol-4-reductase
MARVFITGASGLLGGALLEALTARGDEVVALARSPASADALRARGVEVCHGELTDEAALGAAMAGCELAFNVAGVNAFCLREAAEMMQTNVDGAVAAVRAAHRAGVARLIHTSSAATLGEAAGVVADEWVAHRGWYLSRYEQSKTLGERAAFAAAAELGQDLVCVNPSSVQGPGRAGGTGRFVIAFLDGRLKVFVDTWVSLVDIQDCVAGHLLAAERGVSGERYLLNGIRMHITDLLALAADVAGITAAPRLLPRRLASAGAGAVELAFRLRGERPPICREMVRTLLHGHRYDGSRAQRELGLSYTDAGQTLRRTVEWARAEGLLSAGPSTRPS